MAGVTSRQPWHETLPGAADANVDILRNALAILLPKVQMLPVISFNQLLTGPLRSLSAACASQQWTFAAGFRQQHTQAEQQQTGDTKQLNLCNAVNDALHIAMDNNEQ